MFPNLLFRRLANHRCLFLLHTIHKQIISLHVKLNALRYVFRPFNLFIILLIFQKDQSSPYSSKTVIHALCTPSRIAAPSATPERTLEHRLKTDPSLEVQGNSSQKCSRQQSSCSASPAMHELSRCLRVAKYYFHKQRKSNLPRTPD